MASSRDRVARRSTRPRESPAPRETDAAAADARAAGAPERMAHLDPDEEDDLMADDVRDEDYYAARAVPRDPKKKKKKKKDKKGARPNRGWSCTGAGRNSSRRTCLSAVISTPRPWPKGTAGLTPRALLLIKLDRSSRRTTRPSTRCHYARRRRSACSRRRSSTDKVLEIELQDTATRDVAAKAKRRKVDIGPQEPRGRIARLAEEERLRPCKRGDRRYCSG